MSITKIEKYIKQNKTNKQTNKQTEQQYYDGAKNRHEHY